MRRIIDVKPKGEVFDIKPKTIRFLDVKPNVGNIVGITESHRLPYELSQGSPIGPGFFMFLTYDQTYTG